MTVNTNTKSLFRTFLSYSIPCIMTMFLMSFITIVDGIFIGWKVGENGLAALNLLLPVQYVLLSFTLLIGVGGVTLATQFLGANDHESANKYFTLSFVVCSLINILSILIMVVFSDNILHMLNAKGDIYTYANAYFTPIKFFYIFMMLNMNFSMFIRSEGKPKTMLLFGAIGNVINIILDIIFVIILNLGLEGAAIASGISVLISFIITIGYFLSKISIFKFIRFKFKFRELGRVASLGISEAITQISISITTFIFNYVIIRRIGVSGVAALSIISYVVFIQNMLFTGIAIGIHPVISFNYGARNHKLIQSMLSITIRTSIFFSIGIFAISLLTARGISSTFAPLNTELISLATYGLRLYSIGFIFNGFNIIVAAYFTSVSNAIPAAIISTLRSLVLLVLFIIILPYFFGNNGIWLTVPLSELITCIVACLFLYNSKNINKYLEV